MKVVVTRWEDGQPIYNPRFLSFATHYGFKPWACEPRRPETKGKIERPFDYAERNLLNGRTFRSLEHLNEVARWWLSEVNDRNEKKSQESHRPPSDHHEQLAILREKYMQWGQVAVEYFDGILRKCRNGRHEAQRILSLLYGYPKKDGLAAMEVLKMKLKAEQLDSFLHEQAQGNLSVLETLAKFLEIPAHASQESAIAYRIKRAGFPTEATLESYDWSRNAETITKEPFLELATGEFIRRKENAAFVGESGLGKPQPPQYTFSYRGVRG